MKAYINQTKFVDLMDLQKVPIRLALPVLAFAILSCAGHPIPVIQDSLEEVGPVGLEIVSKFPASWLERIEYASYEFAKTKQDVGCYTAIIGRNEEVELDFVLISPSINLTAAGGFGKVKGCGWGFSYYFDDDGSFVRREIQR